MKIFDMHFPKNFTDFQIENKVLGVSGSPRKNGNSDILLKTILEGVNEKLVSSEALFLRDYQYSSCIGCEKCRKDKLCTGLKDGVSFLYPLILSGKGLILISPSHNYNVTAWMKAFIDRFYCFYDFENSRPRAWSSRLDHQSRKAVIIGICEQDTEENMGFTIKAMEKPLVALGYEIVEEIPVYGVFDRGGVKNDKRLLNQVYQAGHKLGESIQKS